MSEDNAERNVKVITDPAETIAHLVAVIAQRCRIFYAMEDHAGAEAWIAGFPTERGRNLAISIWRAELASHRKDGSRRPARKASTARQP